MLSFQLLSKADDIRDFEIEGMSIGDSLLDFITISKIKTLRTSYYPKSKKYVRYYEVKNSTQYDGVDLYVLDKDKKFIIQSLSGFIEYDKNIKDCYLKKEKLNFGDFFAVTVSSESFLNWLDNEAY